MDLGSMMDTMTGVMAGIDGDVERTIKVSDFVKALELNGYEQTNGIMIRSTPDGKIAAACAFGQAALNLGARIDSLEIGLGVDLTDFVIAKNDGEGLDCEKIAQLIREKYAFEDILNSKVTFLVQDYSKYRNYQGVKV